MKMSGIVKVLSQLVFWFGGIMFFTWLFTLSEKWWMLLLVVIYTAISTTFVRKLKNKLFIFLAHLLSAGVPGVFMVTELISPITAIFVAGIIILSMMARYADSSFMDKGHSFGMFVMVVIYMVGSIMNYTNMWLQFALIIVYALLMFLEKNVSKNEEYVEGISYSSVVDVGKMQMIPNIMTLSVTLIIGLVTVAVSFLAKIPPLAAASSFIRQKAQGFLSFLKRVNVGTPTIGDGEIEDGITMPEDGTVVKIPEGESPEITKTLWDKVLIGFFVALFIACLIYIVYSLIRRLYNHYQKLYRMGLIDEQQVSIKKKKKVRKINPAKDDISYSNRKALRKIYKKRIRGKTGKREDFYCRTPYEQRTKSLTEGNQISEEFVDLYEKARYSQHAITKEDVKLMGKI